MHTKWVFKHFYPRSDRQICIFAVLWVIGLLSGVLLCKHSSFDVSIIFFGAVNTDPLPLILFLICVLPATLSAFAFSCSLFPIACLIVFSVALFQGFSGTLIYMSVGSAAWLLRPMLLFSASCTSVLMWWLLLQSKSGRLIYKNIRFAFVFSCITFLIDLFLVSPLVSDLTKVLLEGVA